MALYHGSDGLYGKKMTKNSSRCILAMKWDRLWVALLFAGFIMSTL